MNVDAKFASSLRELTHEIWVKKGKRPWATLQHGHLSSHPRRYVRELKGDVPTPDKENLPREFIQLQELIAGRKILSPRDLQVGRYHPSGNNDVPSLQCFPPYF